MEKYFLDSEDLKKALLIGQVYSKFDISPSAKLILSNYLVDFWLADEENLISAINCIEICETLGLSLQTVKNSITRLSEIGIISFYFKKNILFYGFNHSFLIFVCDACKFCYLTEYDSEDEITVGKTENSEVLDQVREQLERIYKES